MYSEIFNLIDNCQIIEKNSKNIIIEIDSEEYSDLITDINKLFFIKKNKSKKQRKKKKKKKIGHGYELGNLFITLIIYA